MITTEQINEILKNHKDGISEAQISSHGHVEAKLANHVDANKPYLFVVHPIKESLTLRVWVSPITKLSRESSLFRNLTIANTRLSCGCVGMGNNGAVTFQINHLCDDIDDEPSAEIIDRLLDESIEAVRWLERIVLFGALVESGVPRNRADKIVDDLLGKDEDQKGETEDSEVTL